MYMSGFGMGGMWLWWLLPLLIIVIVFYLIPGRDSAGRRSRALDLLDERLARGEIDIDTYEKLKAELTE